ncbi:unnamed protein product [Calicophoron daubneyi]|uniref:Cyclin-like domain-containing protein n=1 Tax=Calicophoron daubneyi TaxID=300641 RepID=A0AAV2TR91_CALDB
MEQCQNEHKLHLARRQQCACLIQEIGSRVQTTQVVINAGIYYMHHFYEVFSPETIKPILVAIAAFYCACKTEDFSRKLSYLIKATYDILKRPAPNEASDTFKRLVQNIHALEATILMVIGFQTLEVKQPHVLLINAIRANKFPKEISHTSYYVCTNILHLTTLVLHHSAEAIAAASLYIAAKWNSADIQSASGEWFHIFSPTLTLEEIVKIADEFTLAFQACDLKIKEQLRTSLRSRKLQREQREEIMSGNAARPADAQQKKTAMDSTQQSKPDSWKGQQDKRMFNGSVAPSNAPQPYPPNHGRPHPANPQGTQGGPNYPYHGHHRPVPSHSGSAGAGEHFNRPHAGRPQPNNMAEPEPKRPRFDRAFSASNRHSPSSSHHGDGNGRVHRYDSSAVPAHFNNMGDTAMRHAPPSVPPGRPDYRPEYRAVPSTGYNNPSSKPMGRDERGSSRPPPNANRMPPKPGGAHLQANCRPVGVKHDLNDYF